MAPCCSRKAEVFVRNQSRGFIPLRTSWVLLISDSCPFPGANSWQESLHGPVRSCSQTLSRWETPWEVSGKEEKSAQCFQHHLGSTAGIPNPQSHAQGESGSA